MPFHPVDKHEGCRTQAYAPQNLRSLLAEVGGVHQQHRRRSDKPHDHRTQTREDAFDDHTVLVAVNQVARIGHEDERGEHDH